eukprot:NODE_704_length_4578_cov_0.780978.p3 type:complete len:172 gc:universal NODE_704_length_4578_cov_0.780978:1075-560(-)
MTQMKSKLNILVTGTPAVGKTSFSKLLAKHCNFNCLNVSDLVKEYELHDGYDELYDAYYINDDKLLDFMHEKLQNGNCLVDSHVIDLFPRDYFDLVIVLRCNNGILHSRMKDRNYSDLKISENISAEIMQVILDEAMELFDNVVELQSENEQQQADNITFIKEKIEIMKNK